MATPKQELIDKNKLANYKRQMKHDIDILKLDSDFWEYKYKGLHYKTEYARLSADLENFQKAMEQQMQEQVLKEQGGEENLQSTPENIKQAVEYMKHTVTEEDVNANPGEGLVVGEEIEIPLDDDEK